MSDSSGNFAGLGWSQHAGCDAIISVQQALPYRGRITAARLSLVLLLLLLLLLVPVPRLRR